MFSFQNSINKEQRTKTKERITMNESDHATSQPGTR